MEQNNKQETLNVSQTLLGANDKGRVTYQVNGEDVNLSFQIVRNYLTRGNAQVTDAEVIQFISICKANGLNPFIGECWLVKFQGSPASMITARDAFLKRAESSPNFEGMQSGIIIIRDGKVYEEEGAFFLPGDQLVGGWCKVYRSDRKFAYISKVRLSEYNKGKSTWAAIPGTMIQKVAEAQALRKAFPFQMSGLYTPEEMPEDQPQQERREEANAATAVFQKEAPAPAIEAPAQEPESEQISEYDVCDKFCRAKNCDFSLGEHGETCRAAMKRAGFTPLKERQAPAQAEPEPAPIPVREERQAPAPEVKKVEIHFAAGQEPWKDTDSEKLPWEEDDSLFKV